MNPPNAPGNDLTISPAEAFELFQTGQAAFVDVREPKEWAAGCVPHAFLLPLSKLSSGSAKDTACFSVLDASDAPLIVYCHAGVRSLTGATMLRSLLGRGDVYSLSGGIMAWPGPCEPPAQKKNL